jgi:UDP-N-acetylmuramyl pentapeptide phosphotransferase/UDP-N-acetylglucosamine-1-phosphate transferase
MSSHVFFYLGLSLLTMHEMDAIRCKEWRILPLFSLLNDNIGYILFVFLHIPLFFFFNWQLTNSQNLVAFINGLNIFMVIHLGLHILLLKHKNNEFKDWISWTIIAGAGLCGFIDLLA